MTNEYYYLIGLAVLSLSNTILMVMLLVERRYTKRLRSVIQTAQEDYIKYQTVIEQYKHLDAMSKNGIYATRGLDSSRLTIRSFKGTLH